MTQWRRKQSEMAPRSAAPSRKNSHADGADGADRNVLGVPTTEGIAPNTASYVVIDGISKTFGKRGTPASGQTHALADVSLSLMRNEFVSIIGPSGCGKTTLMRVVAGLESADTGFVRVDGQVVRGTSPERAVVFQQPALLPWASVIANVCLGLRLKGIGRDERVSRGMRLLDMVGLTDFSDHLPGTLSGGMQQRVALARALVLDPPILLMDEPFASLDEITRRRLHRELLSIWSQETRTGLFITHNVDEAIILADRVVVMSPRPGKIAEVVEITLPRPRRLEHEHTSQFHDAKLHILKLIESWET